MADGNPKTVEGLVNFDRYACSTILNMLDKSGFNQEKSIFTLVSMLFIFDPLSLGDYIGSKITATSPSCKRDLRASCPALWTPYS